MLELTLLFISGCLVSLVGAFFGIGGGIVVIPLLTFVFKVPIHVAVATSLLIIVANSITASRTNLQSGYANVQLAIYISLFSLIGSFIGGSISLSVSPRILYITLGATQVLTATLMLFKEKLPSPIGSTAKIYFHGEYTESGNTVKYAIYHLMPLIAISLVNGILAGMVGIGGGVVIVPAMNLIAGLPIKVATATSALIMGFTASGSGMLFLMGGYPRFDILAVFVVAIFLSNKVYAKLFKKISNDKLTNAFIALLLIVAISMFYRGFLGE